MSEYPELNSLLIPHLPTPAKREAGDIELLQWRRGLLDAITEVSRNARLDLLNSLRKGLPEYADNTAALAGGLRVGDFYHTAAGILMVVV